jgi:tetrahedral aminopeptidase
MDLSALLKRLSEAHGISAYEAPVREIVREEFAQHSHEVRVTKMGSVVGVRHGSGAAPRRKVMLSAHMDEIGLMVTGVEKGFLRITKVAGSDARVMLGQEVVVHGRRELPGVIGSRPPHVLPPDERDRVLPFDQLFVDVGLPETQVKRLVRVGDLISIRRAAFELKGGLFCGKALDDRASVAAVAVCLETLAASQHKWDVLGVASVQEETTFLGAATSAHGLQPDVAIAIDVTFGEQNGVSDTRTVGMGKGPAIGIGPNFHPELVKALVDTASKLEMPYQMEPTPGASGTDAWPIQVARDGIPTALLSIPLRYMHTPVETVALKDIERTGKLMAEFIAHLDEEFVKTLTFAID